MQRSCVQAHLASETNTASTVVKAGSRFMSVRRRPAVTTLLFEIPSSLSFGLLSLLKLHFVRIRNHPAHIPNPSAVRNPHERALHCENGLSDFIKPQKQSLVIEALEFVAGDQGFDLPKPGCKMDADHVSPERGGSSCDADVIGCLHEAEGVLDRKVLDDSVQKVEGQDGERIVLHSARRIGLRLSKEQAGRHTLPDPFS